VVVLALLAGCRGAEQSPSLPRAWSEPVTGMELVLLDAGSFAMGTPAGEVGREAGEVLHRVELGRPFYMGRFEVTQAQWQAVMGSNPSRFADCGGDCPVETVSYLDVERFLERLEALGGHRLRLPTEAEWEYACRAGTSTAFAFGETLSTVQANFDDSVPEPGAAAGEPLGATMPAGSFAPNRWGLHDLHGNVWEWTADDHCPYPGDARGPLARCASGRKVIRGGSWHYGADSARCGLRYTHAPTDEGPSLGFRLARDASEACR